MTVRESAIYCTSSPINAGMVDRLGESSAIQVNLAWS